ncbi:MAG: KpsF/GutQ family sugar-phosphate isomerase [Hyphomicrobium aestuarii]|nr:KpsF/GutQ family sugar-phosphate isomerase [Hyphomicrobium aestuarii]
MTKKRAPAKSKIVKGKAAQSALRTIGLERDGLGLVETALRGALREPFDRAVSMIRAANGRVIVTGLGKSGHIGQKLAATMASTGTPAFFVHPTEAAHGDLGMITSDDVILALSWSGETAELAQIIGYSRRFRVGLIALTSGGSSALAKAADIVLLMPKCKEACPHGLAPTTSTTMTLATGDCLAIALLESRGFTAQDFKMYHPGGSLGASLKYASDIMHTGDRLPLARPGDDWRDAIVTMTTKALGCLGVVDGRGRFVGMVTDGDLRRHVDALRQDGVSVGAIMTKQPKTITPTMLATAVLEFLTTARISAVFVIDKGKPVGVVHIHDLLHVGTA